MATHYCYDIITHNGVTDTVYCVIFNNEKNEMRYISITYNE